MSFGISKHRILSYLLFNCAVLHLGVTKESKELHQTPSSYYIISSTPSATHTLRSRPHPPINPPNPVNGMASTHLWQPEGAAPSKGVFGRIGDKCIIHNVGIIDRYARRYFLVAYLLLNLLYWYYYK